jgi:colanic acid/amylovoran biosynthesis glycosyltransferase
MNAFAKPKVVVFSDHLLYPSETFIRAQAYALSEFEPVFAGSRRVQGLELPKDHTYTISQGDFAGRLHEGAFKLFGFAPRRLIRPLGALNPVLLHAHYGSNGLRALPLARSLGIPMIVTFHGSDATATDLRYEGAPFGHRRYLARRKELRNGGTLFLAVSQFIRRKLLQQGFPEERVLVHYTGVDTRLFRPASTESDPVILFVGRLTERKGAEFLIRAAAEVQRELAAELIVIGDGPLRTDLERQAKASLRRYRFLGTRNHEEIREWMNRASIFCAPSVKMPSGEEEAFGMVYAEAMAMEKPVVAFDSGGISEVVAHGCTGFLAPERDWQALARYLSVLLKDTGLRKKFGVIGRERVTRQFDLRERTKVLETIYAGVSGTRIHR